MLIPAPRVPLVPLVDCPGCGTPESAIDTGYLDEPGFCHDCTEELDAASCRWCVDRGCPICTSYLAPYSDDGDDDPEPTDQLPLFE